MKIIVDKAIPFIHNRFGEDTEVLYISGDEINPEILKDADALIVRTRTRCDERLLKGSGVKLVASATIGTDHIDIPWCEANGITVKNAPGCNAPGVAQYVLAALFQNGFDPKKHTLGIIGYGNVGCILEKWARNMGIKILINDPPREDASYKDVNYVSLDEILKESDAVSLHVPFTPEGQYKTFHLIGEKELGKCKPDALIVNSSRGGVVNETALKDKLKARKIRAIIDVWENEPYIDTELLNLVVLGTPHIAGYSAEGKKRGTRMVLEAVRDILKIPVDLTGLECRPSDSKSVTRKLIEMSYNPKIDSENLLKSPGDFERLRNEYNYRHEPLFL